VRSALLAAQPGYRDAGGNEIGFGGAVD